MLCASVLTYAPGVGLSHAEAEISEGGSDAADEKAKQEPKQACWAPKQAKKAPKKQTCWPLRLGSSSAPDRVAAGGEDEGAPTIMQRRTVCLV